MADERDGLVFLPSVKANRAKEGNGDKRIGFKSLQTPLVLPSLELGSFDVALVSSLFTHRQICKKVCEWFSAWRSWQQRILLCSVSDKCTKDQLSALVTTLEPVFHRDFTAMLKGRYPTSYIQTKRVVHSVPSADQVKNALQPDQVVDQDQNSSLLSKNFDDLEFSDLYHDYNGSGEHNESSANDKDEKEEVFLKERSKTLESRPFVRDSTLMASEHTVQKAMDMIETRRHEHAPPFLRRVSTPHFFPKFQHQQLGFMKSALRTGDTDNLYGHAPVTFKHDKWWEGHKGSKLLKPRRSKLSNHFKSQIKQIHKWLDKWQIHERVELLSEVVKCCDAESLTFFAQCLAQRLRDITDLNCVSDHILLNIFSYLDVRSLCRSSQVCHRWRFLTNDSRLWKNKITTLGNSEGITGLTEKIEVLGKGQAVDWKQAYKEVRGYYGELAKVKLKEQQQQELKKKLSEARLRKKKPRFSRKSPPPDIKSPEEDEKKTVISGVVEIPFSHALEDIGPAQSPTTADQRDHSDEFKTTDLDGNDLTGGNLKMLARSLQALSKDDKKPDELDLALDIRPTLIQASNLLREDEDIKKHKFRYLSLAVQGVFAVLRVRRVQGHMDAILCLQFDKRRIITGSADRTVRLWDVRSGRSIHKLKGHKGGIRCLQFDDEKIVTGSWDMTVMVWHIVTFQRLKILYGHSGCVSCLQFNDRFLVTGSHDRTIRFWSTVTWECEAVIEGHDSAVMAVDLNEQVLVSASMDRTIKVWDLQSRNCMNTFFGHRDGILSVKVLGNLVLSGSADGMIMFWEMATGACEVAIQAHEGPVFSLDYNDHQHIFSSGGDHLVKEWDVSTCTCLRSLQGHKGPVFCVKAVPHRIVSCSADGFARIWDLDFPNKQGQTKTIPAEETSIQPTLLIQQNSRKS